MISQKVRHCDEQCRACGEADEAISSIGDCFVAPRTQAALLLAMTYDAVLMQASG